MTNVVRIGDVDVTPLTWGGERVVTFEMIDNVHGRPEGTARKRFNDNIERFQEGRHYFRLSTQEASSEFRTIAPNGLIVLTERGYLLLVKSLTDDLAWQVQEQLVDNYFRVQRTPTTLEALYQVVARVTEVEETVDHIKEELQGERGRLFASNLVRTHFSNWRAGKRNPDKLVHDEDTDKRLAKQFTAWIHRNNIFELDGLESMPVSRGGNQTETFPEDFFLKWYPIFLKESNK